MRQSALDSGQRLEPFLQHFNVSSIALARAATRETPDHSSLEKGLWKNAYAGSNEDEFFAELTMWYFGTHGDLGMTGVKPANGPDGLRAYDLEGYQLRDDFYSGRIPVALRAKAAP